MTRDERWDRAYSLLVSFYEYYGNSRVPRIFNTNNGYEFDQSGFALGAWVNKQRELYKKGMLSVDKEIRLSMVSLSHNSHTEKWDEAYQLLLIFNKTYGHVNVPQSFKTINGYEYNDNGFTLGNWVNHQRFLYNNNKLTADRIKRLQLLNFRLDVKERPIIHEWEYMYNLLVAYYKIYGDSDVAALYETPGGIKLGGWVKNQRAAYKENKLTSDRIKKLQMINFRFESKIKRSCDLYGIDYEKYQDILDKLSYRNFISRLYYLLDNYIDVIDNNGNLNTIFSMDNDELYLYTGFNSNELIEYYNKEYMIELIDSYYEKEKHNKKLARIR